jgi:hypothetical protein
VTLTSCAKDFSASAACAAPTRSCQFPSAPDCAARSPGYQCFWSLFLDEQYSDPSDKIAFLQPNTDFPEQLTPRSARGWRGARKLRVDPRRSARLRAASRKAESPLSPPLPFLGAMSPTRCSWLAGVSSALADTKHCLPVLIALLCFAGLPPPTIVLVFPPSQQILARYSADTRQILGRCSVANSAKALRPHPSAPAPAEPPQRPRNKPPSRVPPSLARLTQPEIVPTCQVPGLVSPIPRACG